MTEAEKWAAALAAIDSANEADPDRAAVLYGRRMSERLSRFDPTASVPLQLAARAQHLRRWEVPRDTQPMDRAGYHRWRTGLYAFHADAAEALLRPLQFDQQSIDRVRSLLKKEKLKTDPEMQTLENVICLVFLEHYFSDFARKHPREKLLTILRRTWAKMSDAGHTAALHLPFTPAELDLIGQAIAV